MNWVWWTNRLKLIRNSTWYHMNRVYNKMMGEWQNYSTSKHTNSLAHLVVILLTGIILLLGIFDVCRKFGKYINSSSVWFPVLSSQLGVPEKGEAAWRVTSCYQHRSDDYKYNLQEERKKGLYQELQLTLSFISKQQLGKSLLIISVSVKAGVCVVTQGWLHDKGNCTGALCYHDPRYSGLKSEGSINFQKGAGEFGSQLALLRMAVVSNSLRWKCTPGCNSKACYPAEGT